MKDLQSQIIYNLAEKLNQLRENQIIERLNSLGFKFDNRSDLVQFATKRLTLIVSEHVKKLILDNETLVAQWDDTLNIEFGWEDNSYKGTATLGKL